MMIPTFQLINEIGQVGRKIGIGRLIPRFRKTMSPQTTAYQCADSRKFFCSDCGKGYKNRCSLQKHVKYECGKMPRFHCPYCDCKMKQKYHVYVHVKKRHSTLPTYVLDTQAQQ